MSLDVMKQALEALEECIGYKTSPFMTRECEAAITALRAALEQAEKQEPEQTGKEDLPVAWCYKGEPWFDGNRWHDKAEVTTDERLAKFKDKHATPLFIAQPQRQWQGLTDEERTELRRLGLIGVEIVEAKLKEKNA